MANVIILSFCVFLCSVIITGLLRRYALSRSLIDIPNKRSSHTVPTPRGGGVAIILTFLPALVVLGLVYELPANEFWAMFVAGSWVALIGFWDDHGHIPARWRLLAHFIAAGWVLYWLGGFPPLIFFGYQLDMEWIGHILAIVFLVWLLNLYNFMDGIDGLAGIEAATVCMGGALLYYLDAAESAEWIMPLLFLAAVAGFLFWNFPKARIFMGDAGSGFVGIMLGVMAVQSAWITPSLFWGWMILLGAFIVDASMTLIRRIIRGEKFYEAHRSHAYQYASRYYGSHVTVSLAFGFINLLWLLPNAILVKIGWVDGVLGLIVAYTPLILLAYIYKAGAKELQIPI